MADPVVNNQFASAVGEQLAGQMKEQEALDADFRQKQDTAYAGVQTARDALMESFLGKHKQKGPEYPPEIIEIANVLMAQPRFIEPTQMFLQKLVAKINEAVDDIVSDALGPKDPPA